MNKKFAAVSMILMSLTLTTCSSPAKANVQDIKLNSATTNVDQLSFFKQLEITMNTSKMKDTIKQLKKYVGKTWYVFSGDTPRGWDCSGLTLWVYKHFGIELKHSASVQKNSGTIHKTPKIGDIVAFGWKGWNGAGHVGIYIGNGQMIHAPSPGHRTMIESVKDFAKYGYSNVTYTRIVQTN